MTQSKYYPMPPIPAVEALQPVSVAAPEGDNPAAPPHKEANPPPPIDLDGDVAEAAKVDDDLDENNLQAMQNEGGLNGTRRFGPVPPPVHPQRH